MTDIATLKIEVDATSVQKAIKDLETLAKTMEAAKGTSSDGNAMARAIQQSVEPLVIQTIQKLQRPGAMLNPLGSRDSAFRLSAVCGWSQSLTKQTIEPMHSAEPMLYGALYASTVGIAQALPDGIRFRDLTTKDLERMLVDFTTGMDATTRLLAALRPKAQDDQQA